MGHEPDNKSTSPRKSFGGKHPVDTASVTRPWWQWLLLVVVVGGIIGFVLQMMVSDPAQLSLERLRFLIIYAAVLFTASLALAIIEWRRYRRMR